jgi:hypothetical protein|eukprot:CAMPEP_0174307840 /NCGR_PEP_ID=MMETSP0810-20121108/1372_1 /TAXON_ID=73025 ORGANISM="Eutreptiella gymnastica-like, Strain CCMP1594" /NCGR_SAMPLE_ID=MMETSP0810 /ASSEMBLY_ACC=CAM_ASM_000659 /LENGTH=76 /DNA_ID=CAMNT_0015414995 /DNA_START=377 /DNA_END=607 /DNA_ORIENTATION=+
MFDPADLPSVPEANEALQHDELVVECVYKAATDEGECDVDEFSTGDDDHSDVSEVPVAEVPAAEHVIWGQVGKMHA